MSSKSLDELRYLFSNFDGISQAEFIEQFPEIWDDAYDIEMGSRYHRLMTSCMLAGWFAAIKAVSEREKKFIKRTESAISFLDGINDKTIAEIEVYNSLSEALKNYRGMK